MGLVDFKRKQKDNSLYDIYFGGSDKKPTPKYSKTKAIYEKMMLKDQEHQSNSNYYDVISYVNSFFIDELFENKLHAASVASVATSTCYLKVLYICLYHRSC